MLIMVNVLKLRGLWC